MWLVEEFVDPPGQPILALQQGRAWDQAKSNYRSSNRQKER